MRGELILRSGETAALPECFAYRLVHTDGSAADCFELSFPTRRDLLPLLRQNRELRCMEADEVRFRGVIDEVETVRADRFVTTVCGRGLAAKLMDNQADGAEFFSLDLDTVLARYVRPCGITAISRSGGPWRMQMVSVGTGCTCMKVLESFCLHAGAPQPRFLPDGTLFISAAHGRRTVREEEVLSARWRLCRYGVVSRQKVLDLTSRTVRIAEAPELAALDISAAQVATRSGPFTHLTERTARQRLEASRRKLEVLELVLPGDHPAQPCDEISVGVPALTPSEEFIVSEVCRAFDGRSRTTRLTLRIREE